MRRHLVDAATDLIEERDRNEDRETEWKIGDYVVDFKSLAQPLP
jgi:hypothetical protein